MLLTVHDELLVLSPDRFVEETTVALRAAMEVVLPGITVPLVAEVNVAHAWENAVKAPNRPRAESRPTPICGIGWGRA